MLKQLPGRDTFADRRPGCRAGEHARLGCCIDHPVKAAKPSPQAIDVAGQPDITMNHGDTQSGQALAIGLGPSPAQAVEHGDREVTAGNEQPPADRRSHETTAAGDEKFCHDGGGCQIGDNEPQLSSSRPLPTLPGIDDLVEGFAEADFRPPAGIVGHDFPEI